MTTQATKTPKTPPQDAEPEFVFPEISMMTFVEITTTPDWSEFAGGLVLKVNNRTADILMVPGGRGGGLVQMRDCIHVDDPWCRTRPAMFEDGERGIFRLAKNEKLMRLIFDRFAQSNLAIEELVARIAQLEQKAGIKPQKPARTN